MFKHKKCTLLLFAIPLCVLVAALWYYNDTRVIRLTYEGFTVWLDCSKRGAVKFRYSAKSDDGNLERLHTFSIDPNVPAKCQQTSTSAYKHESVHYDRGHLVPANHLDHSSTALKQSNYVTNTLPQVSDMNRGAWLRTEEITECYRDQRELIVIGGVIWGNNKVDDYFVRSHSVETPDAFWKVIVMGDRVIAWIVPNSKDAARSRLDEYLVSVAHIEKQIKSKIGDVPEVLKKDVPQSSWVLPRGCSKR